MLYRVSRPVVACSASCSGASGAGGHTPAAVPMTRAWIALAVATAPLRVATAQNADSLLAVGRVAAAESALYAASSARPRDPGARARLGQFIALRGGTRAGAVLLEEARQFGGDSAMIAEALAPLYKRLADYRALIALQPSRLTPNERLRAEFLVSNPTRTVIRDSVSRMPYRAGRRAGFGTVLLRIGRAELAAVIDPATTGLVVPASMRSDVRIFGDSASRVGVVSARIGTQMFENISATLATGDEPTRIGFDILSTFSPTFDPRAGRITLHRPERRWRPGPGTRMPALYDESGIRLLFNGLWTLSSAPNASQLLAGRAWTWDARRGDVVLLTP